MNKKKEYHNGNEEIKGRRMSRHHIIPRSRGGREKKNNRVRFPEMYHDAWHKFFGNLTPKEAIYYIQVIFSRKGKNRKTTWTMQELYDFQLQIQSKSKNW